MDDLLQLVDLEIEQHLLLRVPLECLYVVGLLVVLVLLEEGVDLL